MSKDEMDVIDPEENAEALAEAMGRPIQQGVTILDLLNGSRVRVKYMPQSVASSFDFDDGTPIKKKERKPKFNYRQWSKDTFPKMNALALKNIQIVDDIAEPNATLPKNGVRLSLISIGEFKRLNQLCFPGAGEDTSGEQDEDISDDRPRGKGLRSRKPVEVSPTV